MEGTASRKVSPIQEVPRTKLPEFFGESRTAKRKPKSKAAEIAEPKKVLPEYANIYVKQRYRAAPVGYKYSYNFV